MVSQAFFSFHRKYLRIFSDKRVSKSLIQTTTKGIFTRYAIVTWNNHRIYLLTYYIIFNN